MIRWGITANSHDASIAVFDTKRTHLGPNGLTTTLLWAAHSERSSGVKNDKHLNQDIVQQALEFGEPDEIHWYETQWLKRLRQLRAGQYKTALTKKSPIATLHEFGLMNGEKKPKFFNHRHHASHAAAGYYTSPFTEAAVVVIDSIGEFETLTIWNGIGKELRKVFSQGYPDSVGLWYSAMTQRIGLKPNEDEYILMGWAAVGDPEKYKQRILDDFFEPFSEDSPRIKLKHNLHRGCMWWAPELNTVQDYADIAAATQAVYEIIFDYLMYNTRRLVNTDNVVLMGGCALNCVANGMAYKYFKNVWIMPNPGDAGSSVGCVLDHVKRKIKFETPYLGYEIPGKYPVRAALRELLQTGMVGVASGRAEFGPRALGNRSLLADPRGADMQDKVNSVKQRQAFRPFAPVIMAEHVHDYFEMPKGCNHSPYMQFVGKTKRPDLYPAITHLDGTSRVQTVTQEQHPGLYALLEAWYKKTGCPMLLNTSLNIKGEPMVDTEADAERWTKKYNVKVVTSDV